MPTDDVIQVIMRDFNDTCNFTEQQWRELDVLLPRGFNGPDDPEVLRSEFGDSAASMQKKWRDLAALLPPGPKGRDRGLRMFAAAASAYLNAMTNPTPVKDRRQRLTTEIEALQGALAKLGPESAEDRTKLEMMIDDRQKQRHDLQYYADYYEGAPFHRREFVLNALLVWVSCGGKIEFDRPPPSKKPVGSLIDYLTFACKLVMRRPPAANTLGKDIQRFRNHESRIWDPTSSE